MLSSLASDALDEMSGVFKVWVLLRLFRCFHDVMEAAKRLTDPPPPPPVVSDSISRYKEYASLEYPLNQ